MLPTNDEKRAEANEKYIASQAQVSKSDGVGIQNENDCSKSQALSFMEIEEKTKRFSNVEKECSAAEKVIHIYQALEKILESDEYGMDLRKELELSFPNCLALLRKWRQDLEKNEHGIVIAGETSSGKSTLINKILGIKLFKGRLNESTSTICKIRNSDQIRVITTNMTGEVEEKCFSDTCNLQQRENLSAFRRFLKKRTDLTHVSPDFRVDFQTVDIELPVPFLKGNTILVDTPGLGGSGNVTQKLIEYLPNAWAFIFVIDVSSAGGLQKDRLPEILQRITNLRKQSEMPCFSPENAVFITNKWDLVKKQIDSSDKDSSESDDEDENQIWEKLKKDITQEWPFVKMENIFKMNLKDVSSKKHNNSRTSFEDFQKILASMVDKAEDIRVDEHLRFLQNILKKILHGMEKEKKDMIEKQKAVEWKEDTENKNKITRFKNECIKVKEKYSQKVDMEVNAIIQECKTYMSTNIGKFSILNPADRVSIAETNWVKTNIEGRIKSRIDLYAKNVLLSDDVLTRRENIVKEIQSFQGQKTFSVEAIKSDAIDIHPLNDKETESFIYFIQHLLMLATVCMAVVFVVLFACGLKSLAFMSGGFLFFFGYLGLPFVLKSFITNDIDDKYEKRRETVPTIIRTHLQKHFVVPINELVDDVLKELVQAKETRDKQALEKKIEQLAANRHLLDKLAREIRALDENVTSLQRKLELSNVNDKGVLSYFYDLLPFKA